MTPQEATKLLKSEKVIYALDPRSHLILTTLKVVLGARNLNTKLAEIKIGYEQENTDAN